MLARGLGTRMRAADDGANDGGPRVELVIADKGADWDAESLAAPWRLAEARALARRVREMCRNEGYIGDIGLDTRRARRIVECNARGNGHHPVAETAIRLGHKHSYLAKSVKGIKLPFNAVLDVLGDKGHQYGRRGRFGVVPVTFGFADKGHWSFVAFGLNPRQILSDALRDLGVNA